MASFLFQGSMSIRIVRLGSDRGRNAAGHGFTRSFHQLSLNYHDTFSEADLLVSAITPPPSRGGVMTGRLMAGNRFRTISIGARCTHPREVRTYSLASQSMAKILTLLLTQCRNE